MNVGPNRSMPQSPVPKGMQVHDAKTKLGTSMKKIDGQNEMRGSISRFFHFGRNSAKGKQVISERKTILKEEGIPYHLLPKDLKKAIGSKQGLSEAQLQKVAELTITAKENRESLLTLKKKFEVAGFELNAQENKAMDKALEDGLAPPQRGHKIMKRFDAFIKETTQNLKDTTQNYVDKLSEKEGITMSAAVTTLPLDEFNYIEKRISERSDSDNRDAKLEDKIMQNLRAKTMGLTQDIEGRKKPAARLSKEKIEELMKKMPPPPSTIRKHGSPAPPRA